MTAAADSIVEAMEFWAHYWKPRVVGLKFHTIDFTAVGLSHQPLGVHSYFYGVESIYGIPVTYGGVTSGNVEVEFETGVKRVIPIALLQEPMRPPFIEPLNEGGMMWK